MKRVLNEIVDDPYLEPSGAGLWLALSLFVASSSFGLSEVGQSGWPFYPPAALEPPSVKAESRVANDIDRFLLSKLETQGLTYAPEATRRTLVRRLYFDLIGLPPPAEKIEAFVESSDPQAYEKLVDELLEDPRHGERWARFWLDLARYADTAGYEGDPDLPHAWRYRDYVIDSFNRDKPYDQFVREQIAGDEFKEIMGAGELPLPDPEKVVAMTFLRLAPFTEPRGDETRHEMLSEMTSTVSSVFLGLTVGCAQCHDHKYDRIPTKDFYRIKAFFNTVQIMPPERGDIFQIGGALPAAFYREGEKEWAAKKREELKSAQAEFEALSDALRERAGVSALGAGFGLQSMTSGNDYFFDRKGINDGKVHDTIATSDGRAWQFYTDGQQAESIGTKAGENNGDWFGDIPSPHHVSLGQHTAGTGAPSGNAHKGAFAEILIYDHPLDASERAHWKQYFRAKYLGARDATLREPPSEGLLFWLDASDLDSDPATPNPDTGAPVAAWSDRVGGLRLVQTDEERQPRLGALGPWGAPAVLFDNDLLAGATEGAAFLNNQKGSIVAVLSVDHDVEGYGFEVGGDGAFVSTFVNPSAGTTDFKIDEWVNDLTHDDVSDEERLRFNQLRHQSTFTKQHLKRLQPQAMSLRHSFGPPYEPGVPTTRVMIRGEYNNPGEVVEAGFLSCITGHQQPAEIRLDPFKRWPTRSRRMALANWIASEDNPLTARVLVNRLWYRHFGRGIVGAPSDFGQLGGGPSHRELLDWLAVRFVKENWSLRAMHRLIVTSSAYRQDSKVSNWRAAEVDPDNKLLWRFNRRRLEAESIRDSVLATSGRLNSEMFGLPIFPRLPGEIEERVKYTDSKWATDDSEESRKRSIYIYQQRTLTMPFMQTFDGLVCEDTRPQRRDSVTPLQALAMYNGGLVNEEAVHFARRVKDVAGHDPNRRVRYAFLTALGRSATEEELSELRSYATSDEKLAQLCRILYNTNEFIYVD